MGASFGSQDKKSLNVELNIVPFIDLMSCLTAFLLVTAVWVNLSSLENEAAGDKESPVKEPPPPRLTILLEHDQIIVQAQPSGEARRLAAFDWPNLEDALREFKATEATSVEVAASSSDANPVAYQHLVAAMDTAVKAGYPRVGVIDPRTLSR